MEALTRRARTYFIQAGGPYGPIKIGTAFDVERRRRTLQIGNAEELHVLYTALDLEERLTHITFYDLRIRGEWFRAHPRIFAFIDERRARHPGRKPGSKNRKITR